MCFAHFVVTVSAVIKVFCLLRTEHNCLSECIDRLRKIFISKMSFANCEKVACLFQLPLIILRRDGHLKCLYTLWSVYLPRLRSFVTFKNQHSTVLVRAGRNRPLP